jgi:hypothetical protein
VNLLWQLEYPHWYQWLAGTQSGFHIQSPERVPDDCRVNQDHFRFLDEDQVWLKDIDHRTCFSCIVHPSNIPG